VRHAPADSSSSVGQSPSGSGDSRLETGKSCNSAGHATTTCHATSNSDGSSHHDELNASGGDASAGSGSFADEHSVPHPTVEARKRLQKGIENPKIYTDDTIRYGLITSTGEPKNLDEALTDENWRHVMHS
jgi:hypothetical protein